jgi:hypothetical protein
MDEAEKWDALTYRTDRRGKTRHTNIGFAKRGKGEVINIKFESLPIPNEHGEVWVTLVPYNPEYAEDNGETYYR